MPATPIGWPLPLGRSPLPNPPSIVPSLFLSNKLIHAFYEKGNFDVPFDVLSPMEKNQDIKISSFEMGDMRQVGPEPDAFSFSALIRGFCQDGNLEEPKRLYLDLTKNDYVPNRGTFETMVLSLCEAGKLNMSLHSGNDKHELLVCCGCGSTAGVVHGPVKVSKMEEPKKLVELR